tara:strand:- start:48 stop:446 length:399 start_codon:yes stop_codon:yes gene_type:complete
MEQAFEMIEKLTQELAEKEERIIELEKKTEKLEELSWHMNEFMFDYLILHAVVEWRNTFEGSRHSHAKDYEDAVEKGDSECVWENLCHNEELKKLLASEENLEAIEDECQDLKGRWRFYWNDECDLMAEKLC